MDTNYLANNASAKQPVARLRIALAGTDSRRRRVDATASGRYLETRQRLGILPTWSFWNRRDIWRAARWYAHPLVFFGVLGGFWIPTWLDLSMWPRLLAAQAIGVGTLTLALGVLERYVRGQLVARRLTGARTRSPRRRSDSSGRRLNASGW